jgi:DNA transformation protein and related proteins
MNKPSKAAADEFRDYCLELFDTLSPHAGMKGIAAKRMFGGTGFSMDGKTFAIIAFDQLWLKADDQSRAEFVAAKCPIFTYAWTDGVARNLSYYSPPSDAMESGAAMRPWAALAWDAALRAAATKIAKPKKPKKITE